VDKKIRRSARSRTDRRAARAQGFRRIGASAATTACATGSAALDPKTGGDAVEDLHRPAPGEPGSETWKDKTEAWRTGGARSTSRLLRSAVRTSPYWGTGNPAPRYDSAYRPGDNLFTDSSVAFDARPARCSGTSAHQNDNRDYDSSGSQIIIDGKVNGEDRKLLSTPIAMFPLHARPGQRPVPQGRPIFGQGHLDKGIDPEDRQAIDYEPPGRADLQPRLEVATAR